MLVTGKYNITIAYPACSVYSGQQAQIISGSTITEHSILGAN